MAFGSRGWVSVLLLCHVLIGPRLEKKRNPKAPDILGFRHMKPCLDVQGRFKGSEPLDDVRTVVPTTAARSWVPCRIPLNYRP